MSVDKFNIGDKVVLRSEAEYPDNNATLMPDQLRRARDAVFEVTGVLENLVDIRVPDGENFVGYNAGRFARAPEPRTYTQAELDAMLSDARRQHERELRAASVDRQAFKVQVATEAMKAASEHGWCAVVRRTLENMGIDPELAKTPRFTFEVTRRYRVTASRTDDGAWETPSETFIGSSLAWDASGDPDMDSDWTDVYVDVVSTTVDDVCRVDEE